MTNTPHPGGVGRIGEFEITRIGYGAMKLTDAPPKHGHDGSRCTPSIDGDRLYAIISSGKIVCLKAASGDEEAIRIDSG